MFKKLLHSPSASITSAALIIAAATLASKVLGVLRTTILTKNFPTDQLDIYFAAFRIPDFVFNIIVLGALSAGFIPVFTRLVHKNKEKEAFRTASNILNILLVSLLFITLLAIFFTPEIIDLITPGFDHAKKWETIRLSRIMFLSPLIMLLSSITGGILQSYKRFAVYSLSPLLYNVGIIIGAEWLAPVWGLQGLAWGVVIGAFLQFIIQLPVVRGLGFKYELIIDTKSAEVRRIFRIMLPRLLTIIVSQINLVVITIIASTLQGGSIAIFSITGDLQTFPLSIFAISFAIAVFPTLSHLTGEDEKDQFSRVLLSTARQILYLVIPFSVLMIILRAQIVRLIFGHGYFNWTDTVSAIEVLFIFCLSLFAQALIPLFCRAFWALQNSRTPFVVDLVSALINIVLAWQLSQSFGLNGLALAFTLSSILNAFLLFVLLRGQIGRSGSRALLVALLKISTSAILAGFLAYRALHWFAPLLNTRTTLGILIQCAIAGLMGAAFYLLFTRLLKVEEFFKLRSALRKKIFRTNLAPAEILDDPQ